MLLAAAVAALSASAEKQPYSRYSSIVDRQMFGELPPGFDPTKMPSEVARTSGKQEQELTKEQEQLKSAIHFSAINVTPDGATAVGFTDNSNPKAPVHYYLKKGEERDGWKVEAADAKTATLTIVKGDIEVTLTLGGNSGKGGGSTAARGHGQPSAQRAGFSEGGTLRARRLMREQRREAEVKARFEEEKAEMARREAERDAKAAEEKAQREVEREEQRKALQEIQEALKRQREEMQKQRKQQEESENADDNAG